MWLRVGGGDVEKRKWENIMLYTGTEHVIGNKLIFCFEMSLLMGIKVNFFRKSFKSKVALRWKWNFLDIEIYRNKFKLVLILYNVGV